MSSIVRLTTPPLACIHPRVARSRLGRWNAPMTDANGQGRVPMLVVDDQETFREMMRDLVAATPGFELVGEAASGEDALVAIGDLSPELVLMDVRMPGIGGIEATRRVMAGRHDIAAAGAGAAGAAAGG